MGSQRVGQNWVTSLTYFLLDGRQIIWPFQSLSNCCLVTKSCTTLCNSIDCSPPGSFVHGISQARTLEWAAISFSSGSSQSRDQSVVSGLACGFFTTEPSVGSHPSTHWWFLKVILHLQLLQNTGYMPCVVQHTVVANPYCLMSNPIIWQGLSLAQL